MRIGSLCSGYGGLDHAVEEVFDAKTAWVSDVDKGACKILNHRYPDVPNIGDMTTVDWTTVEPVEVLTAGYPCQPFSHAGRRKGTNDVRHLWPYVREAVRVLRPRITVLENVAGHRSLGFDRVLGDLAEDGLHVRWTSLRAADIGAPHSRERLFIVVTPDAADIGHEWARGTRHGRPGPENGHRGHLGLLPTPTARDFKNAGDPARTAGRMAERGQPLTEIAVNVLLPTPNPFHMGNDETPEEWRNRRLDVFKRTGTRHGPALNVVVKSVLEGDPLDPAHYMPDDEGEAWTPSARPAGTTQRRSAWTASSQTQQESLLTLPVASVDPLPTTPGSRSLSRPLLDGAATDWGLYAAAIARWEHVLGRPAPPPTMTSTKGNPQLSPAFVEWMMGLPAGWVTDVPGITRNEALKALGNGVVPQQAVAALRTMLAWEAVA